MLVGERIARSGECGLRERHEAGQRRHLDRAEDLLKGMLLYSELSKPEKVAVK